MKFTAHPTVTISDFKLSKYEITNSQFIEYLNERASGKSMGEVNSKFKPYINELEKLRIDIGGQNPKHNGLTDRLNKLCVEFRELYKEKKDLSSKIDHFERQVSELGNRNTDEIINEIKLEKRVETINKIIKTN